MDANLKKKFNPDVGSDNPTDYARHTKDRHKLADEMVPVAAHSRSKPKQKHPAKPAQPSSMKFLE